MRDYQPKKNNPYRLPQNLYNEVKYMIKDYGRLKEEYEELTAEAEEKRNWVKLCTVASKLSAIKNAFSTIPAEYRDGLIKNLENERTRDGYYPLNADYRTYQNYKRKLIYFAALNMNYV
jgi:2'-5' RNA ligase